MKATDIEKKSTGEKNIKEKNEKIEITTLIENMQDKNGLLQSEHGLSLYIEAEGKNILFDTGQTGAFADNAKLLEKSLEEVDLLILSHGHYDHSGGVPRLLTERERKLRVYAGEEFFEPKYKKTEDGGWKYNGNPFEKELLTGQAEVVAVTESVTMLGENLFLFKNFIRSNEFEQQNPKFFVKKEESYEPDDFRDEIVLGIRTKKGLILIAGCSHVGIVNIIRSVKAWTGLPIYGVLGGTHLVEADENRLERTIEAFRECGIREVAVSHCTGEAGICRMQEAFGEYFILNNTGNIYEITG